MMAQVDFSKSKPTTPGIQMMPTDQIQHLGQQLLLAFNTLGTISFLRIVTII
jgi:hypothetical protein